ncbi:MAG: hypothetical protein HY928_13215 [Elusimicrobia bacterium]|nr:hypothetical protein [Elusimicrobiota bacterium]
MSRKKFVGGAAFMVLLAVYGASYAGIARGPAANLAYFVYSEDSRVDAACYYLFLPAYRLHQRLWEARDRGFVRHNWDRQ